MHCSWTDLILIIKSELDQIEKKLSTHMKSAISIDLTTNNNQKHKILEKKIYFFHAKKVNFYSSLKRLLPAENQ